MKRPAWLKWLALGLGVALAAVALVVGLVVGIGRLSQTGDAPDTSPLPPGAPGADTNSNTTTSSSTSNSTVSGINTVGNGTVGPTPPGVASRAGSAIGSFPPPPPPPGTLSVLGGALPPQSVVPLGGYAASAPLGTPRPRASAPLATPPPHAAPQSQPQSLPQSQPLPRPQPQAQGAPGPEGAAATGPGYAPGTTTAPLPSASGPLTLTPHFPTLSPAPSRGISSPLPAQQLPPPTSAPSGLLPSPPSSLLSPTTLSVPPYAASPPALLSPSASSPGAPPPTAQAPLAATPARVPLAGGQAQPPLGEAGLGPRAPVPRAPIPRAPIPRAPAPRPLPEGPGASNRVLAQVMNYTKLMHQDPSDRYLPCSDLVVGPDGNFPRRTVIIQAKASGPIWRGWGTSLTWWPRLLAMYPARFYTPLMNLVFNRKNGLGLNMVRYNIPAGHKPHLSPNVSENPLQAQGFRPDPLKPYNWSEDAAQIRVLKDSKAYGATVFEAISYSPPWWMTKSGDVSGGDKGEPNLQPRYSQAFANYIADVVDHFKRDPAIGIQFDYVAPFNEPVEGWWTDGRVTEGCGFTPDQIGEIVTRLDFALKKRNLASTKIGVLDSWTGNTIGAVEGGWKGKIPPRALEFVDHFTVHGYVAGGSSRNETTDREAYLWMRSVAKEHQKEVFQTEWGPLGYHGVDIQFGILLARVVMQHVNHMGASAWFLWQAIQQRNGGGWGPVQMPLVVKGKSKAFKTRQFFVLRQLVFAMPPGSRPLKVETDCGQGILAAFIGKRQRLSVTVANQRFAPFRFRFDLSEFEIASGAPRTRVKVYRTSSKENFTVIDEYSVRSPLTVDLVASPLTVTTVLLRGVVRARR